MNRLLLAMIGRRLALGALTLAAVAVFIFSVVELLPGDVAQEMLGNNATPETVAAIRRELGLDKPALTRFLEWSGGGASRRLWQLAGQRPSGGGIGLPDGWATLCFWRPTPR